MRQLCGVLAVILCSSAPWAVLADGPAFKRLSVADIDPNNRITVQIDAEEQAAYLAALPKVDPNPPHHGDEAGTALVVAESGLTEAPISDYGWYWDLVPVGLADTSGRFDMALAALTQGPEGQVVRAPRMQSLQTMAESYGKDILMATLDTRVSPALVLAVMGVESGGNPEAVSSAGAVGLMQLIPATADRFGVSDSTDPMQNIKGGVAYLDWLMGEFDNDPLMVIAAYNSGEGAVRDNGGVPPFAETRDYVPKVLAAWQVAQGLCVSQPLLISDPCIFRTDLAGSPDAVEASEPPEG